MTGLLPWAFFLALVAGLLVLDLGVFHRRSHAVSKREALAWSGAWIGIAAVFNAMVYVLMGGAAGVEWTTGYLIEKSLAVDNIFIFLLVFSTFAVPAEYQHRVLFWGIVGAIVTRGLLIAVAGVILSTLHVVIYVFGAFLVLTGIKFFRDRNHTPALERNPALRLARRFLRTTEHYEGQRFWVRRSGVLYATPLFLVLVIIEATDVVFAVDSIPAIYAVTDDPFIVFTSNIFAILGLRSLYFVLAGYLEGLTFLKPGLAAILMFVGIKMLVADVYAIPPVASLGVILAILAAAIGASWLRRERAAAVTTPRPASPVADRQPSA